MKPSQEILPIFALDPLADWDDISNAMHASVQYCTAALGGFGPLFAFAPMTEPANLDKWEPITVPPKDLLLISIARQEDKRLLKAFEESEIGPPLHDSPDSSVQQDGRLPIADIYRQMEQAGVVAYCMIHHHENDPSSFFIRGTDAIGALNRQLTALPR